MNSHPFLQGFQLIHAFTKSPMILHAIAYNLRALHLSSQKACPSTYLYIYIYIYWSQSKRKILNINPWAWRKSGSIPGSLQMTCLPKQTNALEVNRWADPPFKPSLVVSASATGRCGNKTQRRPLKMWENFEKCSHLKVCIYWIYHMSHKKNSIQPHYTAWLLWQLLSIQQITG